MLPTRSLIFRLLEKLWCPLRMHKIALAAHSICNCIYLGIGTELSVLLSSASSILWSLRELGCLLSMASSFSHHGDNIAAVGTQARDRESCLHQPRHIHINEHKSQRHC